MVQWGQKSTIAISVLGLCLLATPFLSALDVESYDDATPTSDDKYSCASKETCSSCIQTEGCAWCSKPDKSDDDSPTPTARCRAYSGDEMPGEEGDIGSGRATRSVDSGAWCPSEKIVNPESSLKIIEDKPLQPASKRGEMDTDAIQLRPQKVKLRLRVDEPFPLRLQYAQAEDYPVDLYYLMDLSASMADDKEKLSILGDLLAREMSEMTSNFRLGFGSFVDKIEMPFVSTVPDKLKQPCTIPKTKKACAPPYGFINHMPLNLDTAQFKEEVKRANVSGNLDSPEGGLDALMQVIVCRDEIGWRTKARHIIILSTDAVFHLAGDGKLAGIVEPNDGLCHLNKKMEYTHGEIMDYPSISQINQKAQEHNMNVIFAVTKRQTETYELLAHRINGASAGTLTQDSSNVVKLVRDQYDKLVDAVTLVDDAESHVQVRYFSSCLSGSSEEHETKECGGLRVGNVVNFTAYITVLECPKEESNRHLTFQIKPQSLNESVEVDLEIICDCPCEKPDHPGYELDSKSCSEAGVLQCGVCVCNEDRVGRICQCDRDSKTGANPDNFAGCVPGGNASDAGAVICSNLGTCKCGVCDCTKRPNPDEEISGQYCECDNFSCKREEGKVCSGPERGTCKCGKCVCSKGWTGPACECRHSNDSCIRPGSTGSESNKICSGHGVCDCGQCHCDVTEDIRYSGKYCEDCPTCPGLCEELRDCVECQAFGSSGVTVLGERECLKCKFVVKVVESLSNEKSSTQNDQLGENEEMDEDDDEEEEAGGKGRHCSYPDNAGCTFFYEYQYDKSGELIVIVQEKKECGPSVDVLGVVLGVIGSIVLAGVILLLVWKLLTTLHDRREYVRFEKERQMAKWDRGDNPLYQKATTSFNNPTFGK